MSRQSPLVSLEEISGTKYPDLTAAQRAALKATAYDIAATLRALLTAGILAQVNGKIIPQEKRSIFGVRQN